MRTLFGACVVVVLVVACDRPARETAAPPPAPVAEVEAPPPSSVVVRHAADVETGRVVVRLRTWADEPVVGAAVAAAPQAADGLHWPWWSDPTAGRQRFAESVERATTDAAGEATFEGVPVGTWSFVADATGFATLGRSIRVSARPPATITLRLEQGASLDGRVLDADGSPAAGATVILGIWNSFDPWRPFRAVADAEGRFAFDGVASGEHGLFIGPRGAPTFRMCRVSVPDVERIDVRLPRPSVARGVVVDDETDRPIAGALVELAESESVTDTNGRYEITATAPLSEWRHVSAFKDGYAEAQEMRDRCLYVRPWPGEVVTRDFRLRRGGPSVERRAATPPVPFLERTAEVRIGDIVVRGRVRMPSGAAMPPGTRVSTGGWDYVPVRADGTFVVGLPADAKRFSVRAEIPGITPFFWDTEPPSPRPADSPWIDVVAGKTEFVQDIDVAPGFPLSGRVVAKDTGAPVAGAWILVRYCCILGSWANPVRATTDADGRFRIMGVAKFRWPVGVEAPGFVTTAVWMDSGGASATIALERELSIDGFVRFADGTPATGVEIRALLPDCVPLNPSARDDRIVGVVDSAGRFRVRELPPGRYALQVGSRWSDDKLVLAKKVLDVAAGSTGVEIVVERAK